MYILTYGTLRRGHGNSKMFGLHDPNNATYIGPYKVKGGLYDLGWYPGWKDDDNGETICDLWKIHNQSIINRLDSYEGYTPSNPTGGLYNKKTVRLHTIDTDEPFDAMIYEYNGSVSEKDRVTHGDWMMWKEVC